MDPDEVIGLDQRGEGGAETLVDPLVAGAEGPVELGQVDPVVEERPQRPVGVAVIIFVDILFLEVDGGGGDAAMGPEMDLAAELLRLLARPAEPEPVRFLQRCEQGDGQPALRALGGARLGRGHPVGDDNKPAHQRTLVHGRERSPAQLIRPTSE